MKSEDARSNYDETLVARARELATTAHEGQYRSDGITPYVRHPESVAARLKGDSLAEAVAWLHDVLEDTATTVEDLRAHDIPEEVIACVSLLTKTEHTDYQQYLAEIRTNPIAKRVKIADMLSNLGDDPSDKQILKYARGLIFLLS